MTLRLTPANIEAAYEYLLTTAPFNKWKLPPADDLEFQVISHDDRYGHFHSFPAKAKRPQVIAVSAIHATTTYKLFETMAHELCHLKHMLDGGYKARGYGHGPTFKRLARQAIRVHGFDPNTF